MNWGREEHAVDHGAVAAPDGAYLKTDGGEAIDVAEEAFRNVLFTVQGRGGNYHAVLIRHEVGLGCGLRREQRQGHGARTRQQKGPRETDRPPAGRSDRLAECGVHPQRIQDIVTRGEGVCSEHVEAKKCNRCMLAPAEAY